MTSRLAFMRDRPLHANAARAESAAAACDTGMDASARDLAALQGTWEQVAFEENGVVDAPDSTGAPGSLTTFSGDRFSVRTLHGELLLEGRFILDASSTPAAIT
jgi:hypothetical protein